MIEVQTALLCGCGCGQPTTKARNGSYNQFCLGHNTKHSKASQPSKNSHPGCFQPGNTFGTGRPQGSKNSVTVASENLLEGEAEALTRKLIDLALDGNVACLRHAIDRIHPVKRSAPIRLKGMPEVSDIESAAMASGYLLQQVRDGVVSPIDAEVVSRLIDKYISATKWTDIEKELHELQARIDGKPVGNSVG